MVGLETELALEGGEDGALDTTLAGERETTELGVDEELAIKDVRSGVERRAWDGRVDIILSGNGVSN